MTFTSYSAAAGKFLIAEMTREHLVREAHLWGVPERVARAAIERTLDAMKTAGVPEADRAYPAIRPDVRATALEQVERLSRS